jgi:hypothetical protein
VNFFCVFSNNGDHFRSRKRLQYSNNYLSKFYLLRDRVPTVLLEEWPLSCRLFDGEAVSGPVPTLFSDRPDAARQALESDPERACQDLAKIFRKFAIHEYIPAGLGWATVLKPR